MRSRVETSKSNFVTSQERLVHQLDVTIRDTDLIHKVCHSSLLHIASPKRGHGREQAKRAPGAKGGLGQNQP